LQQATQRASGKSLRLIKGSQIVVRRLFDHPYAYIFQYPNRRLVFAIPYEHDFTLIGTTHVDYHGDVSQVAIDANEIGYLCDLSNRYFRTNIVPAGGVGSYSGARPPVEDDALNASSASSVTRDYRLELDTSGAPLLSVFGGKIVIFRELAEEAVDMLAPLFPDQSGAWKKDACLPGGDLFGETPVNRSAHDFDHYVHEQKGRYTCCLPSC
jgi:glycerol-3-phosphate dehydrogenase